MRRASMRDLPADLWQPRAGGSAIPFLLPERPTETVLTVNARACETCGVSLVGRRRQALFCSDSCRVVASKRRRAA